jgi:hypothetical protein
MSLNNKGSVMLTTNMDLNTKDEGPAEVDVALTYGGKWSELLNSF